MRYVLKIIHNEHIALLWALAVELLVHGFFGLQAFLLGGFLGEVALIKVFGPDLGVQIGAWSLGILVFGMAFVSFVLGEYLKEHVQSFVWSGKGSQEYLTAFRDTVRLAMGLELSSLSFRVLTVGLHEGDWPSASVIAIAGIIGLWYAVKMAKVIHASVNRPIEHDLARSQRQAGQTLAEKAMRYTPSMSPEQLARWADGDASALQEVAEGGFFEEEQKKAAREVTREQKQQTKQRKLTQKETNRLNKSQQEEEMRQRGELARETSRNLLDPRNWKRNRPEQPTYLKVEPENFPEVQTRNQQAQRLNRN